MESATVSGLSIFKVSRSDDTLIVEPLRNVSSLAGDGLQAEIDALVAELDDPGLKHVVLDFGRVAYFGSAMLEAMQELGRRVRRNSGKLASCNVSVVGREVLHVVKFDAMWPVFDTREGAMAAIHAE